MADKEADMGSNNAFKIHQYGSKKVSGVAVYYYTIAVTSQEGKDNLLDYKINGNQKILPSSTMIVEFREPKLFVVKEEPGVLYRVALPQTNTSSTTPLSRKK